MSLGNSAFSSISAARGATRSCTSSRIVSRIATCSSDSSKSISVRLDPIRIPYRGRGTGGRGPPGHTRFAIGSLKVARSKCFENPTAGSYLHHFSRDDDPLHLVRALIDLERFGVAHMTLEWAARKDTLIAGQLQRVEGDLHGRVGAVQLRHRGCEGERAPGAAEPRGAVSEHAGRLETRGHVGQPELFPLPAGSTLQQGRGLIHRRKPDPQRLT